MQRTCSSTLPDTATELRSYTTVFFNNFTILWQQLLESGRYKDAESLWEMALQPALDWEEQNEGTFIHKGTPLYFWGMTSILRGDLDQGYVLIHQALSEDYRAFGSSLSTPAFALVTLNYAKADQAFRRWVLQQAEFLEKQMAAYRQSYPQKLDLSDFRKRFLSDPLLLDAVFMFAYTLARLMRIDDIPNYALANPFVGQLEANLLFDITLAIDAAGLPPVIVPPPGSESSWLKEGQLVGPGAGIPRRCEAAHGCIPFSSPR